MRLIEYCDSADAIKLTAAAVSAYSFKCNGGFPESTEYILYCPETALALENVAIRKVFNRVLPPPIQFILDAAPSDNPALETQWQKATWSKFLSWVHTPCDGKPVFHADYDTLCCGSVLEAVPVAGKFFSGRLNKENDISCNGGFYVKTPEFDESDAPELMTAPVLSADVYKEAYKLWWATDEMGVSWFFHKHGFTKFYELDWRFNMPVYKQKRTKQSVETNDVRVLHFMGVTKPWNMKSERCYKAQRRRWLTMKERMLNELEIR